MGGHRPASENNARGGARHAQLAPHADDDGGCAWVAEPKKARRIGIHHHVREGASVKGALRHVAVWGSGY